MLASVGVADRGALAPGATSESPATTATSSPGRFIRDASFPAEAGSPRGRLCVPQPTATRATRTATRTARTGPSVALGPRRPQQVKTAFVKRLAVEHADHLAVEHADRLAVEHARGLGGLARRRCLSLRLSEPRERPDSSGEGAKQKDQSRLLHVTSFRH